VHSYEIELFTRTGGIAVIDDCQYPITRGDIRFHRPGQIVWSCLHYECYGLRLSLDGTCPPVDQDQPLIRHPYLDIIPPFLSVASPDRYFNLFDEILRLSINPPPGGELLLKARVLELLYRLYADALQLCTIGPPGRMTDTLTRAMDFIAARYKEPLRLTDIARSVNLSPHHFHRLFTRAVTLTPLAYLTKVRIERAREQLLTGQDPIADIALACGFENQSYFAKVFRQQTGVTPGQFRRHRLSID
jgi:AraC-like DNA-binding protein